MSTSGEYFEARHGETTHRCRILSRDGARLRFELDGHQRNAQVAESDGTWFIEMNGVASTLRRALPKGAEPAEEVKDGNARAPFAGAVVQVAVEVGQAVTRGTLLVSVEAMKIESPVEAYVDGTVAEVRVKPGDQVASGQVMVVVEEAE